MERVFTGVMIAELHVLTIGHEARSIEQTFFGNSNIHVYDAWVAIGIDAYTVDASVTISVCFKYIYLKCGMTFAFIHLKKKEGYFVFLFQITSQPICTLN